ncbi:MAG TPA: HD domain-containing phosphohydrolase [Longimicrobium sp.]
MSKPAPRAAAAPEAIQKPADDAAPDATPARTPSADAGGERDALGGARATAALAEVLVRLLERDGPVIRAESSLRRLLVLALGRELGLPEAQQDALSLAALLGALGELGEGAAQGGTEAGRHLAITLQLLSGVSLPATAREALAHQYERWDGGGLPSGLREEQIPFPARVLAVARAAAALLGERGPGAAAVVDELQRQAGSAFDPLVVSVLRRVFAQRERHGIGYGWGGRVAVAHPRELRALELAARLHGEGYAAETAGTAAALRDRLRAGAPQALVIGADLPDADAAALVREVRAMAAALPVLVVDAADARRRVELLGAGADVCFPPDADFLEVRATLDALLRRGEATFPRETPLQLLEEPRASDAGRPAAVRPIAAGAGQGA